jgi:sugar phosphate isomerase/epimerase
MNGPSLMLSLPQIALMPITPPDLVTVASAAGFQAIGLRLAPLTPEEVLAPMLGGDRPLMRETKSLLRGTGLQVLDVEIFRLAPAMAFDRYRGALEGCAEIGARDIIATCNIPDSVEAIASFAEACKVAAEFDLFLNLEFMPWNAINTLDKARAIVEQSRAPNGRLLLDTLHIHRSGTPLDDLLNVDGDDIRYLQICDAGPTPEDFDTMLDQARFERRLPGEGVIPIQEILSRLPKDVPVSVEVPMRSRLAEIGVHALAKLAYEHTRSALLEAGWTSSQVW